MGSSPAPYPSDTRILMFHRVRPLQPVAYGLPDCYRLRGSSLTPGEFKAALPEAQSLSLRAIERALQTGEAPPPGAALTFDDGYREHLEIALELAERGLTATFYVATGLHGAGSEVAPVDAWYWLLDNARRPWGRLQTPAGLFEGPVDTLRGKLQWVSGPPKAALLAATQAEQAQLLSDLASSLDLELPADLAQTLYLRPAEWAELARLGMDLGAHSVTHPRLSTLGPLALCEEVSRSTSSLSARFGPVSFAYPDGDHDHSSVGEVMRAGARSGVTCVPGPVTEDSSLFKLPREFVTPELVRSLTRIGAGGEMTGPPPPAR